jgi:hypothetical protein
MTFAAPDLCFVHLSMAQITTLGSTVDIAFRTPLGVLLLTKGGRSGIGDNLCADLDGLEQSAQIHSSHLIPDPPLVLPLTEGGGSRIRNNVGVHLDGSELSAQIDSSHLIPDPPLRSTFNGGGGPELVLKNVPRSTVRNPARGSTDHDGFQTPLGVLLLIKGGGGPERIFFAAGPVHVWHFPIGPKVPSSTCCLTPRCPRLSSSTKPTCPT